MIHASRTTSDFRSIKFFVASAFIQIAYMPAHAAEGRYDMYAVREIVTVTKTPSETTPRSDAGQPYKPYTEIASHPNGGKPEPLAARQPQPKAQQERK
ncbi:hypothetical protein [Chromobacterium aquaticum]|uniref:Uncharacterized protein n=1 Tax=Chromobacterium aquaticum TaxID=467180 RepID=A0ABV8ZXM6_9NEIS|nr:hypothetical protein [Chromobacterium aquaticum]MCD5363605.1 hypothetical protein [Chromobacterium aquaticum]